MGLFFHGYVALSFTLSSGVNQSREEGKASLVGSHLVASVIDGSSMWGHMRRWQMMELDPGTVSSEALLSMPAARADALAKLQFLSSRQATRSLSPHNKTTISVDYVQLHSELPAWIFRTLLLFGSLKLLPSVLACQHKSRIYGITILAPVTTASWYFPSSKSISFDICSQFECD